uniref:Acid ceramidase n=2 Tax=Clastoptera arizonana TaxID=38151 RepID=A0A1B6E234_9HEMI
MNLIIYLNIILLISESYQLEPVLRNKKLYQRGKSKFSSPFEGCSNITIPKTPDVNIPKYVINLDLQPNLRWKDVIRDTNIEINALLNSIKNNTDALFGEEVFKIIDKYMPWLTKTLPLEYYSELVGISQLSGLSVGEVTLFNVFYEFFSVCTSIIMQENNCGKLYLGRNLDFGLFLGWDAHNHTWLTSEYLRHMVVHLDFVKNNNTIFSSISFAGYIGVLTAVKKNMFGLTVNERFILNGGYVGLAEWILGRRNQKWMGILTREVMETASSYKTAQKMLAEPQLIAPVYFILAGSKCHQGCIITRARNECDIWELGSKHKKQTGNWYLIQTNYDHWQDPPFFDNRRDPAITCIEKYGRQNSFETLFKVLSTKPVLNKLTTYTALMDITSGKVDAWVRLCENPCWPW